METSKPLEKIYIHFHVLKTQELGEVYILFALDDYSRYVFPPVTGPLEEDISQRLDSIIGFYNGIRKEFNAKIHALQTAYHVNLPEDVLMLFQSIVREPDSLTPDPDGVEKAILPVLDELFGEK